MTNKNILKAFSALDADIVIGCEPSGAPVINKKKRTPIVLRLVAIAACVALLATGIVVGTLLLNREDDQPDVPSVPTKKTYEMYMNFSAGDELDLSISENEKVELKPSSEKNFDLFSTGNKIEKPANISDSIDINFGGKSYSLNCFSAYTTAIDNAQKFKNFGTIAMYRSDDRKTMVEMIAETKEIALFLDLEVSRNIDGDFSADEAKQAAEMLFIQLYGEGFFNDYEYDGTTTSNEEREKVYSLCYKRTVWGFDTDDSVVIVYNFNGELVSFNAYGKGMMEFAEEDLTKEEIEGAIAAVTETFSDTWYIGNSTLTLDSEGDYYLMTYLVHADEGEITELRKVYTKIK